MRNQIVPVTRKYTPPTEFQRRLSEVFEWLPELLIMGFFLLAAMIASGIASLICLVLAAGPAVWIIGSRARTARENAKVLAEYDTKLDAADARALDTLEPGDPR